MRKSQLPPMSRPVLAHGTRTGAWNLWETLARERPQFGNPAAFDRNVPESVWESFSVTVSEPLFLDRMQAFTGSVAERGALRCSRIRTG